MSSWKGFLTVVTAGVLLAAAFGLAASPTQRTTESGTSGPGVLALDDLKNLSLLESRVFRGEFLSPEEKTTLEQLAAVHDGRRSRGSHLDNVGGPDDYGYVYIDNQAGDTATYNWIELRGDPQATWINNWEWTSHDDAMAVDSFPIGFDFPFYGETYTHINVCTNGHIQFASRSVQYWDICLPVESIGPAIFIYGDDLHLDYGGMTGGLNVVGYRNFGEYFVIEYDSVGRCCSDGASFKFEAILFPSGKIKLQYQHLNFGNEEWWDSTGTIGIQQSGTGSYLQYVCDSLGFQPVNGLAIWFAQPTGVPSSVTELQGIANGTTVSLAWYDPVTDTYGNPVTLDSLRIERDGDRTFTVAPGVQGFSQTGVSLGSHEYAVRAFHGSFGSAAARVIVSVGSSSYYENFDLTDGGWLPTQGWEWGPPSNAAPHSAPNVWGDRLSGEYVEESCDELRLSPGLAVASADATVEFYCWYNTEFWWDGVEFQASVDGDSTWEILFPSVHPYDIEDSGNDCFGANPHWCGMSQTWVRVVIPIGQYVGQTPSFRFMFGSDPSIVYPGFLFDDFRIWGLAVPVGEPVSGTITLDGGAGSVTQAVVRADGLGGPTASPSAGGAYTLANVQRGQRMLTAELLRYAPASRAVLVPPGGIGGQNMILRRLPPPAPSGLFTTQDTTGQFVTLHWNVSSDALVDQYRVYRKLRFETTWTPVRTVSALQATDTLPSFNAWQYSVTAVDTNVTPPALESPRSATVQVLYGAVPPSNLTAQQNFDDHIHLGWNAPGEGAPPLVLQYDDGTVESWLQISSPNGPSDFFAVRFDTPLPEGSLQYPLPLRACNIYLQGSTPLPEVWLCGDRGGSPDLNSLYAQWMNVGAEDGPGWLTLPVAGGTELAEPGTVWLVWRQPAGTELAVGADQTSAQPHSYYSEDGTNWHQVSAASLAGRLWIGGDSGGDIVPTGPSSGYPPEWIARRFLTDRHQAENTAKTGSKSRGPVALQVRGQPFSAVLSRPTSRFAEDPYIEVPGLEFEFSDRHASTLDDPNYYIVYRNSIDIAHPVSTSYNNTVAEGIAYNYYVTAHYPNGSESGPTNTVTATATMPPGAPQNLTGLVLDAARIRLLWLDPTVNQNGTPCTDLVSARVYRNGVLIATVPAGAGRYTDTPPFPNRLSLWSVRAIDEVPNEGPGATLLGSVIDQWLDTSYVWIDISNTGTPVVNCDDCMEGPFAIGFPFTFYGNTYDSVRIASNGYLTFMNTWPSNWNEAIPNVWEPNNAIYAFWDDMNPTAGGQVLYYSNPTDSVFVVSFIGVAHFAAEGLETFQIVLRPSGSVRMSYQTVENNTGCTIGVENSTGTVGLMVWYNGAITGIDWPLSSQTVMDFWGMPPRYASVSGHVTLDGGSGNVAQASVRANGASHPVTNPAANGNYVLHNVVLGSRILTCTLAGYHQDTLHITVPDTLGLTNQNLTLRRLDPPAPTGLVAVLNTTTGRDSLHWDISPDALVDQYRVYRKLRDDVIWVLNRTVGPVTHNWAIDTLTVDGIYQYRVTAVDTNVTPPAVESGPSISAQVIFGEVPPERLIANGHFDNKIALSWLAPGSSPPVEVFYDSVDVDSNCVNDGLGFNGEFPFAWFVAHYQGTGEVRIERIRTRHWPWSTPGAPVQLAVFDDAGDGTPTFVPLGTTDTVITDPTTWLDVTLQTPVVIPNGSFFVGIRQVTAQRVDIGMDWCAEQQFNTFFYTTDTAVPWTALELGPIGFPQVLVIRATVIGDMGGGLVELTPTPVEQWRPPVSAPAAQPFTKAAVKAERGATKQMAAGTVPLPLSARVSSPQTSRRASQAGPTTFSRPRVTWDASASGERGRHTLDEVLRYRIYRDGVRYDSVTVAMTSWENTGLIENQSHSYYVTAVYDNGQASSPSNTVSAACNMEPGAPTDLVLTAVGMTQMRIQWTDPAVNADGTPCVDLAGVRVYRDGELIGTAAVGAGQYVDVPPDPMFFYVWEVRGYDEVPNIGPGASQRGAVQSPWRVVEFEWLDVWNLSTPVVQCDDCSEGPFDLGFTFTFYGQTYESIHISSNGFLSFTSEMAWGGGPIPSVWEPNAAIYAFSTDLLPTGGQCRYYSDPVHERFVVTFQDCPHYGNPVIETFQIILEAEDGITLNYQTVSDPSWCLIGVENADGTDALQLYYAGSGDFTPVSQSAVQFWGGPNSSLIGTVRAFGTNATIANASVWVTGQPDTAVTDSLGAYEFPIEAGTYTVTFQHRTFCDTIHTNVVVTEGEVTVHNALMRAPQAQFSHTSLSISTPRGVNAQTTFTISNNGGQCPLTYSISDTSDWLSASPASGQVAQNQSVTITALANVQGMPANSERHSVLVFEYNATGSPHPVPVDLFVGPDAVDPAAAIPTEFAYHPNYPNPFNATTTFAFDVPKESEVRIIVFNLTGQEVAAPVTGRWPAGRHHVTFDAGELPSGMYLVRMSAGDFHAVGKMLLLK